MAKKRRRQKLQPRPVRDQETDPTREVAPAADQQLEPSMPPTGMPTAAMPPTAVPQEQGYVRGGSVHNYQGGGEVEEQLRSDWRRPPSSRERVLDAASTVVQRPPAPRGSLPDQLGYNAIPTRGYANGGDVDPMDYVPK